MNILVVGNGFDIAHGLATEYKEFIEFMSIFKRILDKCRTVYLDNISNNDVKEYMKLNGIDRKVANGITQELLDNTSENLWFNYFSKIFDRKNNGWIDFEKEIAEMIKFMDELGDCIVDKCVLDYNQIDKWIEGLHPTKRKMLDAIKDRLDQGPTLSQLVSYLEYLSENDYRNVIETLEGDLYRLIRCLEIYLCDCIEKCNISIKSPDIEALDLDYMISFNYINTYNRLYEKVLGKKPIKCDFIHGYANIMNNTKSNNMVLGIDEYLSDEEKNVKTDFIAFKKYYQRIYNQTGCKYKLWIEEMRKNDNSESTSEINAQLNNVYIFGHSLDITDKDILKEIILQDKVITTIYYHDRKAYAQQIANLVKVIGQDELIKRVSEPNKTIIFKQQRDMIPIV